MWSVEAGEIDMKKNGNPEYISITEMAQRRNVSTETLRHYDRIGLLKPDHTSDSGVRFYSVLNYEKMQTIKELKQIGMSLADIRNYFENRDFRSSYELIVRQKKALDEKIRELREIQRQVEQKKAYMETITPGSYADDVFMRDIPDRYYFTLNTTAHNEIEQAYQLMQLENQIYDMEKYVPFYATKRYAGLISDASADVREHEFEHIIFADEIEAASLENCRMIEGGRFCCTRTTGMFLEQNEGIERLFSYLEDEHLQPCSDTVIANAIVDYTISDKPEERLYELQVRISDTP